MSPTRLAEELAPTGCVLVPFDFSEPASRALRAAKGLVSEAGDLHVVHVLEHTPMDSPGATFSSRLEERERTARELLSEELSREGLDGANGHVLAGTDAASPIADLAGELHADLIVLATHGRTGLARIVLGSVAERVLRLSPCPVLVVPART